MNLGLRQILTVWRKEIVDNLRDRRTLTTALLMPVVVMPALLTFTFKLQESQIKTAAAKIAKVAVQNADAAPQLVTFLRQQPKVQLVDLPADPGTAIDAGTVNVIVEVPPDYAAKRAAKESVTIDVQEKSSNYDSSTALGKVTAALTAFNQLEAAGTLKAAGIPPSVLTSVVPLPQDLATPEERGGFFVGLLLPMFIVLFAIIGGMYIAIDTSAGEKERKTLEALLFTPVPRLRLVLGKYLAVATMAIVTIVLSVASLYASFRLVPPPDFGGAGQAIVINLTPAALGVMLGIGVILAVMFAGLLLSVAIFAKSYKEAQNYISPFYLVAVLPITIMNTIPGFKPSLGYFAVPGVNAVFVMKEVLLGVFSAPHILVTVASLVVFAALGIVVASRIYSKESILFRD